MDKYSKEQAIKIVTSCAEKYRDELANRELLFICIDKQKKITYFEFTFNERNFMHLTGLKVERNNSKRETSATNFYNKCLAHKLSPRDFEFADDGTTHMKLHVLPYILNKNLSANMIGDYDLSRPYLYTEKLAGGTKACVGFTVDAASGTYVPNTVLKEDIRNTVTNYVRVIAVYRKKMSDEKYKELTYCAKDIDLSIINQFSDIIEI